MEKRYQGTKEKVYQREIEPKSGFRFHYFFQNKNCAIFEEEKTIQPRSPTPGERIFLNPLAERFTEKIEKEKK